MSGERYPRLRRDDLDADGRALYDAIAGGPRAGVPGQFPIVASDGTLAGPFGPMLYSPAVGDAMQQLGARIRTASSLTARDRELLTLAVAVAARSGFEIAAHVPLARAAGLEDAVVEALLEGRDPGDPRDAALVRFARAAVEGTAPHAAAEELEPWFGARELLDIVAVAGYYRMLAVLMDVFGIDGGDAGGEGA